jgi:hypothetical protein
VYSVVKKTVIKLLVITLSFAIFVALMITGCSRNRIPVERVREIVTLDGVPAADVTVTFVPKSDASRPASGRTNEKGEFEMFTGGASRKGVMAGEYYVLFSKSVLLKQDGTEPPPPFRYNETVR